MDLAHSLNIRIHCRNDFESLCWPINSILHFPSSFFHRHSYHYIIGLIHPFISRFVDNFLCLDEKFVIFVRINQ